MTSLVATPKPPAILYGNGIHASKLDPETGKFGVCRYQFEPKTIEQFSQIASQTQIEKDRTFALMKNRKDKKKGTFGFAPNLDLQNLADMGWGLVFPAKMPEKRVQSIVEALAPLIEQRKKSTGENKFRVLSGLEAGVLPNDSAESYLRRFKLGPGAKDLEKVPGYLVLIGDPEEIPFRVQYQLDVDYMVGRLYFNPVKDHPEADLEQYWRYANQVVQVEDGKASLSRTLRFFRPDNNGDPATSQSAADLVQKLAENLPKDNPKWDIAALDPKDSIRSRLQQLMGGAETPAILFTASHGMALDPDDVENQLALQGALVCQDWQGLEDELEREDLMGAEDLLPDANLVGSMAFLFACYGAGTPRYDNFIDPEFGQPQQIAPNSFMAALPQKLLSRGALAVMGHVDRAWTYSFQWEDAGPQTQHFEWALTRLMSQNRVGHAIDYFNDRYSTIATDLVDILDKSERQKPNPYDLVRLWTANNDARDYILVGDPACQLSLAAENQEPERPSISISSLPWEYKEVEDETSGGGDQPGKSPGTTPAPKSMAASTGTRLGTGANAIRIRSEPDGTVTIDILPAGGEAPTGRQAFVVPGGQTFGGPLDWFRGGKEKVDELQQKLGEAQESMANNLGNALKTLGAKVQEFSEDVASLEIDTYTSRNLANSTYDKGEKKFTNAELRAKTLLKLDGDASNLVPLTSGGVDKELWEIHLKMVEIAQANRTEMIKAIGDMITKFIPGLGG